MRAENITWLYESRRERNTSSLLLIWGTYCGETKAPASICFKPLAEKERNYTDDGDYVDGGDNVDSGDYVDSDDYVDGGDDGDDDDGGDYGDYVDGDNDIGDDNDDA